MKVRTSHAGHDADYHDVKLVRVSKHEVGLKIDGEVLADISVVLSKEGEQRPFIDVEIYHKPILDNDGYINWPIDLAEKGES
jgi:hypothetical protein